MATKPHSQGTVSGHSGRFNWGIMGFLILLIVVVVLLGVIFLLSSYSGNAGTPPPCKPKDGGASATRDLVHDLLKRNKTWEPSVSISDPFDPNAFHLMRTIDRKTVLLIRNVRRTGDTVSFQYVYAEKLSLLTYFESSPNGRIATLISSAQISGIETVEGMQIEEFKARFWPDQPLPCL